MLITKSAPQPLSRSTATGGRKMAMMILQTSDPPAILLFVEELVD